MQFFYYFFVLFILLCVTAQLFLVETDLMSFLIVFLKWKETKNPVFVITTFFVFWATIFGVERYPFACHIGDGGGIYEIFRAGVCMLITFIYTVWCKGEIEKFFEKLDVHVPAPSSGGPLPF
eukprot:sb/3475986/